MKNKNILLSLLTSIVSLVLIVPMFLNVFGYTYETLATTTNRNFGIFADYSVAQSLNPDFNNLWSVVFNVCMIVGIALAALYVIIFILELLNVKLNIATAKKIIGVAFIITFIISVVSGILFMVLNGYKTSITTLTFNGQIGFYLTSSLLLVSGVLAFVSAKDSTKKRSRRRK